MRCPVCAGDGGFGEACVPCDHCKGTGSVRTDKFKHVRMELEGLSGWLTSAIQSNPESLNISFNKFELASLADRINAVIKETNWND